MRAIFESRKLTQMQCRGCNAPREVTKGDLAGRAREGKAGRGKEARRRLRALNNQHGELLGRIQVYKTSVTQQRGFIDCGVFVLMFAEELLRRMPDGLDDELRRMRREGAERKQAGREWQQGKDRRAGEGEGERWAAWITGDAAQGQRGEITRVLRGLEANAKGRAKGESGRGIVTNVTGVEDAASTNEGEGTVYVETGGAGYCIRWRAEEAGKAAEGVVGGGADREGVDSEPENAVGVAEARGQAEHRVEQEGQRQQKRGQKRKAPENAAAGIVDRESSGTGAGRVAGGGGAREAGSRCGGARTGGG
jgi:hypothetical protein